MAAQHGGRSWVLDTMTTPYQPSTTYTQIVTWKGNSLAYTTTVLVPLSVAGLCCNTSLFPFDYPLSLYYCTSPPVSSTFCGTVQSIAQGLSNLDLNKNH